MGENGQAFLFIREHQLSSELPGVFCEQLPDLSVDHSTLHWKIFSPPLQLATDAVRISREKKHLGAES